MIKVSDGTQLYYQELKPKNPKQTIVMLPGGGVSAEIFKLQINAFSKHYHVIAIDQRGHGKSEKPSHGYMISRLAKDLQDVLEALNLNHIILMGHSMGCSVIWNYWELFAKQRLAKLILIDESPILIANPAWNEAEREITGAIITPETLYDVTNQLREAKDDTFVRAMINDFVTRNIDSKTKEWITQCMLTLPMKYMADLYFNNMTSDWRRVIPTIDIPTLVIGGKASLIPWQSQQWIHQQITHSKLEIFAANEGGSHFMFVENPEKFNRIMLDFVANESI